MPNQIAPLPRSSMFAAALVAVNLLAACGGSGSDSVPDEHDPGASGPPASVAGWQWQLPAGFAPPRVPADNPMSVAKVELGRHLFHDPRLSADGTLACSGCHEQVSAFSDGRSLSRGVTGQVHPRNSLHLTNVAYRLTLDWANPQPRTLEAQMLTPLLGTAPVEMGINDGNRATVLERFRADADYRARFAEAFAGETEPVSWDNIIKAIAAWERTLIAADSRFDRYRAGQTTLDEAELRGMALFFGERGQCSQCHGSANFDGQFVDSTTAALPVPEFHNTGLFNIGGTGAYPAPNRGIFEFTGQPTDMGRFRAPSLRNVALSAPYMHDGSMGTLETVLAFYAAGGRDVGNGPYAGDGRRNPFKDTRLAQIQPDAQDQHDLIAFLKTLTDESFVSDLRFRDPFAPAP